MEREPKVGGLGSSRRSCIGSVVGVRGPDVGCPRRTRNTQNLVLGALRSDLLLS
jgi:hypothetical protein